MHDLFMALELVCMRREMIPYSENGTNNRPAASMCRQYTIPKTADRPAESTSLLMLAYWSFGLALKERCCPSNFECPGVVLKSLPATHPCSLNVIVALLGEGQTVSNIFRHKQCTVPATTSEQLRATEATGCRICVEASRFARWGRTRCGPYRGLLENSKSGHQQHRGDHYRVSGTKSTERLVRVQSGFEGEECADDNDKPLSG